MRVYLRIAKTSRGHKVAATTKPTDNPLTDAMGGAYPTVAFAIEVKVPLSRWALAQQLVAAIEVPEADSIEVS